MYIEKEPKTTSQKRPLVVQKRKNKTGLPDQLKSGMESLSGMSLDHVKVHFNSPKPAAVQAHAYAQGSDIHLAPGQSRHLPHELGHVVQQAQGRVKPTTSVNGMAVNDSPSLEKEADRMGGRAMQRKVKKNEWTYGGGVSGVVAQKKNNGKQGLGFVDNRPEVIAQRKLQEMANNSQGVKQLKALQNMTNQSSVIQMVYKGWTWDGTSWIPDFGSADPQPPYQAGVVGARCVTDFDELSPVPDTTIDWADLVSWAIEEGCQQQNDRSLGTFLGPNGATTYPHFHVWRNGIIALSTGHNINDVVGQNGTVNIAELGQVLTRRDLAGPIKAVIQRILSSAS